MGSCLIEAKVRLSGAPTLKRARVFACEAGELT